MKCLSIRPPWAGLVVSGGKPYELRSWSRPHRGDTYIHASLRDDPHGPWHRIGNPGLVSRGALIGIARLVEIRPMTPADADGACHEYVEGILVWVFADPRPITPIPWKGKLGLFEVNL